MVDKTDEEKHFSWCYFLLHLPLLFVFVTVIPFVAFLCFLSFYGFSSLLVTMAILFISTFVFLLRFFKKKTRDYLVDRSQNEVDDTADAEDEDGLIEILLVSEEAETIEATRNTNQSRQRIRVDEDEQEEIDDVIMEEDNLIEIDLSIGSIKRRSK
ncbi:BnaA10g09850D [Brassica napus]|uniref:BnaA10g09850D protein n=1 Tax=Brassica napus TaxID=3708 RepID=A0A078FWL5_BRANA|nr:BnaA10g09850D [Brassica napus]